MYCPNSPEFNKYHPMRERGIGVLYRYNTSTGKKTLVFKNGVTYQCSSCLHVIVMQYYDSIGYYATWNPGQVVSATGTVLSSPSVSYSSSTTLPGYKFY